MRNGVDERIVLLIAADLPHQKKRIENYAADDDPQQQDAKEEKNSGAPGKQNPTDIEEEDDEDQGRAQGNEKRDRPFAAADHASSLA